VHRYLQLGLKLRQILPFYLPRDLRMNRQVKGTLFVDYVRILRAKKGADWSRHLSPGDLPYLSQRIEPNSWYPMETFERMGLAILAEITPSPDLVQAWGRAQIDWLWQVHPNLVVPGDALETLMRFRVVRASFFNYEALRIADLSDGEAVIMVSYGMSPPAEEAATHQTLGFFERLLEVAGATQARAWLSAKSWEGALATTIRLRWEGAAPP
jgi:hypothetical protein